MAALKDEQNVLNHIVLMSIGKITERWNMDCTIESLGTEIKLGVTASLCHAMNLSHNNVLQCTLYALVIEGSVICEPDLDEHGAVVYKLNKNYFKQQQARFNSIVQSFELK